MPASFDLYEKMFTKVDALLTTYWSDTAASVASAITPVATTLIMIYTCLWGWSMMRGMISEPITDGVSRIVRLSVITGIALSVGRYSEYLANMLWNSPDALAAIVASGQSDSSSNMAFLDEFMGQYYNLGKAYTDWATAHSSFGIPSPLYLLSGLLIMLAGVILTGYAAFLLLLAKMSLAVILGLGPLFILMMMFEPTKRFFDSWIGQALNSLFTIVLTAACLKLIFKVIQAFVATSDLVNPSLENVIPATGLALIGVLILLQVGAMASALGGGTAVGTLGAVGWAYRNAKNAAAPLMSPRKTLSDARAARRARETNARWAERNPGISRRVAGAVGGAVAAPPMAVYRKITSRTNRVAKA